MIDASHQKQQRKVVKKAIIHCLSSKDASSDDEQSSPCAIKIKKLRKKIASSSSPYCSEIATLGIDEKDIMSSIIKEVVDSLVLKGYALLEGDGESVKLVSTNNDKKANKKEKKKRSRSSSDLVHDTEETKKPKKSAQDNKSEDHAIEEDEATVIAHHKAQYKKDDTIVTASATATDTVSGGIVDGSSTALKVYPVKVIRPEDLDTSILLFYQYCLPPMSRVEQDKAIAFCYSILQKNGCSGRLRVGREGFNATLTGPSPGIRVFTSALKKYAPQYFSETDFKYVDQQLHNQRLKGLKVWPVTEIVTYGFDPRDAPLDMRGTHLAPHEFHKALENPNSVVIDVRNFNESLIGKFAPPTHGKEMAEKVLDPCMRRSTEFPDWVEQNKHKLEGKQVLMYCTAGVRCERASAFMRNKGIENVFQLEGGIHRYLEAYEEDGGHWIGKNYTFDKRFSHGAKSSEVISVCSYCDKPWDRYQAQKTCFKCQMEVLLCKDCQRCKPAPPKEKLICPLCK